MGKWGCIGDIRIFCIQYSLCMYIYIYIEYNILVYWQDFWEEDPFLFVKMMINPFESLQYNNYDFNGDWD